MSALEMTKRDSAILGGVFPLFRDQAKSFLGVCWDNGIPVHLSWGFRTFAEQDDVYRSGKSHAKGGQSFHNYGLAFDIVFDNGGGGGIQDPYREPFGGAWLACAQLGAKCGLQAGYFWASFQDKPHYQAKIRTPIEILRSTYLRGGISSVWDSLMLNDRDCFKIKSSAAIMETNMEDCNGNFE